MPEEKDPTTETVAPAPEAKGTGKAQVEQSNSPAEPEEEFDKERAMATILKLRETESKFKKMTREMERIQEEERKRKEAEMTDVEKYKAKAEELENALKLERTEKMRLKVSSKYQLPEKLAARLQGETEEEMEADAAELAKLLPKQKQAPQLQSNDVADGKKGETDAQKRARIYNKGANLFDVDAIRERGGGVFFNQK